MSQFPTFPALPWTPGDLGPALPWVDADGVWHLLPFGAEGQVLAIVGGVLTFIDPPEGGGGEALLFSDGSGNMIVNDDTGNPLVSG